MQAIEIFDDEINEGREVFYVFLQVVSNISNNVTYRIQTTLCRIRQSDRKLSSNLHVFYVHISGLNYYEGLVTIAKVYMHHCVKHFEPA